MSYARPTRRRRYVRLVDRLLGVRFTPDEVRQITSHHRKDRGPLKKVIAHNRSASELQRHHAGMKYSPDGRIVSFVCLNQQCKSACVRLNFPPGTAAPALPTGDFSLVGLPPAAPPAPLLCDPLLVF